MTDVTRVASMDFSDIKIARNEPARSNVTPPGEYIPSLQKGKWVSTIFSLLPARQASSGSDASGRGDKPLLSITSIGGFADSTAVGWTTLP